MQASFAVIMLRWEVQADKQPRHMNTQTKSAVHSQMRVAMLYPSKGTTIQANKMASQTGLR